MAQFRFGTECRNKFRFGPAGRGGYHAGLIVGQAVGGQGFFKTPAAALQLLRLTGRARAQFQQAFPPVHVQPAQQVQGRRALRIRPALGAEITKSCPVPRGYGAVGRGRCPCLLRRVRRRRKGRAFRCGLGAVSGRVRRPGTTKELPYGVEGEICLAGPTVMLCYVNHPKETADTMKDHGDGLIWVHTGDLGKMDEEGFIYFRQRIKRMIVTNGYNVYPSQIENVLEAHEAVHLACVIGVKDPIRVQRVKAFVMLKPGYEGSEELKKDILEHCSKYVARYAMPRELEFRPELPKTLVGKVAYRVLEEEANAAAPANQ